MPAQRAERVKVAHFVRCSYLDALLVLQYVTFLKKYCPHVVFYKLCLVHPKTFAYANVHSHNMGIMFKTSQISKSGIRRKRFRYEGHCSGFLQHFSTRSGC